MNNTFLLSSVTVEQYRELKTKRDTDKIATLIYDRFNERYIEPFKNNEKKHGFSMMAISCLMIEALQSFKKGCKNTNGQGKKVFEEFFYNSKNLHEFKGFGEEFYRSIRCGILHQAETYEGWKIRRDGKLLDKSKKSINATKFMCALANDLRDYETLLKSESFDSDIWKKAIKKLDFICSN